ncbi:MAG TPA: UPF0280 family protein [Prolixibacteraceae bacterium]|nr:UPF0280 family protein [Prolixibacteraceae bacterium]
MKTDDPGINAERQTGKRQNILPHDSSELRGFGKRFYRERMGEDRFRSFVITCKDSDLWIGVDADSYCHQMKSFALEKLIELRYALESYIHLYPEFQASFVPVKTKPEDPAIAVEMSKAAQIAGTGPMAAVAGAFAEFIGKALLKEFKIDEIVIENGGDIFLQLKHNLVLSIYAGESALTGKLGLEIPALATPLGVCTSSGTVGPSISFGRADAIVIASKNTALADAFASAYGNKVKSANDISDVIKLIRKNKKILSSVIICEGKAGICGQFNIKPTSKA